jgi:peroxiredoxin
MRKTLVLAAALAVLASCKKTGDTEYIVSGNVKGIADGKMVMLQTQDETGMLKSVDTVKVQKEKFVFEGKAVEPEMYLVQVEGVMGKIPFILEEGEIEMTIDKDSLPLSKIKGSYNNDELNAYKAKGWEVQKKMIKFQQDNMAKMELAQKTKDMATIEALQKEYTKFQEDFIKQNDAYVSSHPKAFISALIIEGMFNQGAPDIKKIKGYYDQLDESVKNTKHGKKIKKQLDELGKPVAAVKELKAGDMAPDFSAPDAAGKTLSLKQSMGKITIVDFWASWCNPCRAENPNMVALYKEFHGKGLNIISVSLDSDAAKWKGAIAKDGLTWTQVSNLKEMEDPIADAYGVKLIPTTFVLDASGKILARDLRGAELKEKVKSLLK